MNYYSIEILSEPTGQTESLTMQKGLFDSIARAVDPQIFDNKSIDVPPQSPSYQEVMQMINQTITQMRVYVVESEITNTQNAVKTVIEQASF